MASDLIIGLAYYSIPIMLAYFIHKRRDTPFKWIFLMFGTFIIACGTSHLIAVWTLWHPDYWLFGGIKLATAIVSLYTAVDLFTLIPKALALPSPAQLEATNQKLAQEIGDRILAEAALKQSESRFRSIFEDAAIGIVLAEVTGELLTTNPAFQKMLGYRQNELSGMHFTKFTHPESISVEAALRQEMMTGLRDFYQLEKCYIRKDGQLMWGHLTVSLVRDAQAKPQFSIAMVENITERKQAEAAVRHYQEHLEELVGARTAELTQVNEQLSWQASHDALTGLVNRREFEQCLENAVNTARTSQQEYTLCYMDLDHFKIVNDTCGHVAGDELLRQLSYLLQSRCRKTDTLARLGGDEFGLLLHQCSLEEAQRVIQTLQESIQEFRFVWQDKTFSLGISIGLVAISHFSLNPEAILNAADAACYTAKKRGRNQAFIYQVDERELQEQRQEVQWVERLIRALNPSLPCESLDSTPGTGGVAQAPDITNASLKGKVTLHKGKRFREQQGLCRMMTSFAFSYSEQKRHWATEAAMPLTPYVVQTPALINEQEKLCLYYQPIIPLYQSQNENPELATCEQYEVLLRLVDETGEVIPPMSFLPVAKRYDLMPLIDRWVIQTFFAGLSNRYSVQRDKGQDEIKAQLTVPGEALYTINLSSESIKDDQLIEFLKAQFCKYQIPPQAICFEIAEAAVVANIVKATQLIGELKTLGCYFALDDFGSAMSSFAYLKHLSVDYLKINADFVKDVVKDPIDCVMVEAIHNIGRIIEAQSIAEFVADEMILEKVKALGIDYAQGYAIAEPQPLWQ